MNTPSDLNPSNLNFAAAGEQLRDALDLHGHDAAAAVLDALRENRIDGGTYYGVCSCLFGTIAVALGLVRRAPAGYIEYAVITASGLRQSAERTAVRALAAAAAFRWYGDAERGGFTEIERVFECIHPRPTPERAEASALASAWAISEVERWIECHATDRVLSAALAGAEAARG